MNCSSPKRWMKAVEKGRIHSLSGAAEWTCLTLSDAFIHLYKERQHMLIMHPHITRDLEPLILRNGGLHRGQHLHECQRLSTCEQRECLRLPKHTVHRWVWESGSHFTYMERGLGTGRTAAARSKRGAPYIVTICSACIVNFLLLAKG